MSRDPATAFDREAWEERAGIWEYDGGLPRDEAEAIAWAEDDRRRAAHLLKSYGVVNEQGGK